MCHPVQVVRYDQELLWCHLPIASKRPNVTMFLVSGIFFPPRTDLSMQVFMIYLFKVHVERQKTKAVLVQTNAELLIGPIVNELFLHCDRSAIALSS